MSFLDKRTRRDGNEGRRVEKKYIVSGVIGAENLRPDALLSSCSSCV